MKWGQSKKVGTVVRSKQQLDHHQQEQEAEAEAAIITTCSSKTSWHKAATLRIQSTMLPFLLLVSMMVIPVPSFAEAPFMGINYGQVGDDLPSDADAVTLIKNLGAGQVKIYNTDPGTLNALANSGLDVVIGMDNTEIPSLGASAAAADEWIVVNVLAYVPATSITVILVGNELFSSNFDIWPQLIPAIQNLQTSLTNHGLTSITLSTACELSILSNSYPPSAGVFNESAISVLMPLLQHLEDTNSYLYINAYPYFAWVSDPSGIPLDYAIFSAPAAMLSDGQYSYTSLLEAQIDTVYYAMEAIGFTDVRLAISESGWPTAGGVGADLTNAEAYNNNLVKYILSGVGTPKMPQVFVPTYIFALFNEDLKPGPATERNWGLLYPNGSAAYTINLADPYTSSSSSSGSSPTFQSPSSDSTTGSYISSTPDLLRCGYTAIVLTFSSVSFLGILFNLIWII
ncbi:unnamed protein product [Sphagnum jensenii]|uniref:Glucan endo-1,3-beta-D-glucosidase n=1 Tax=Sphagnum jensenii TaxID=128206 RepID=A0ABP0XB82_9BRYO